MTVKKIEAIKKLNYSERKEYKEDNPEEWKEYVLKMKSKAGILGAKARSISERRFLNR